ncbi:MAG: hypothetical protein JWQ39_249 [Glaciihabitans sp.]|nr:hypothetical protein [Glaciihabitans sp.]
MEDELDDTITVPRLPFVPPPVPEPLPHDLEDTMVAAPRPPDLVEPALRPRFDEPSGIELTADVPVGPITAPITQVTYSPQEAAPAYFRFRIGRTVVWLDAVSYVGRRPSSPRIIYGQMPRLVRVPSPGHEVSSTHVELRQLGASVVLTDMRSTNGSVVFAPGGSQRKLRQGESVVVSPGTLVDIGDGNVIEILPPQIWTPADALQPEPEEERQ